MRMQYVANGCLVFLLVSSLFFVGNANAQDTRNRVDADITLEYQTGSELHVHVKMAVSQISVFDQLYSGQQIGVIATSDQEVMGAIKLRLRDLLKDQVTGSFPDASVVALAVKPTYQNSFFYDDFSVNLTSAFFKLDAAVDAPSFINGVLDMGAVMKYTFPLQAETGWNNTYTYVLPSTMALDNVNTPALTAITWVLENGDGSKPTRDAVLSIHMKNPTTPAATSESIALEFELDTRAVNTVPLTTSVVVSEIDIRSYSALPDFISGLSIIPADGVRLLTANGLLSWNALYQTAVQPIEEKTRSVVENSSLNHSISFAFSWDPATTINCSVPFDVTHMDESPPVKAVLREADVPLRICGMSARAFFGLINAGAGAAISTGDMNFGDRLEQIGYPYTVFLQLPVNVTLAGENRYRWNQTMPLNGAFYSDHQPSPAYMNQSVGSRIEIDLAKLDLNIFSFLTGKTEFTATAKMKEDDSYYVMRWPSEFRLSSKMNLSFLNADAFRLCVEESVFSESDVGLFLSGRQAAFETMISPLLHDLTIKGIIDRKVFSNSLAWDGDISAMDDVSPVVTSVTASESYPVAFNLSLWPASMSISQQQFTLSGLPNQTVTYRIIFPKGISAVPQDSSGKAIIRGNTTDGRQYVEISFDTSDLGQTTVLTCGLNASPLYIIGMFLPCMLVFILLIILVVAIILVRKKRRGFSGGGKRRKGKAGKAPKMEDNEVEGFEGQEYYVPPPPPSRKK